MWKENFDRKEANELMRDKKLKSEIGHLKAAAERSKKWADTAESRKIGIDPTKTEKSAPTVCTIPTKTGRSFSRASPAHWW